MLLDEGRVYPVSNEKTSKHGIPKASEFFLEVPPYQVFSFDPEKHYGQARDIKYFQGTLDSYCPWCQKESVFENQNKKIEYSESNSTHNQVYTVTLLCSRNKDHELFYVVKVHNRGIQKIGQHPSLADLQLQDLKKYAKILGGERHREFTRAVGLSAHGVGVGSFVYLRRIFESLIEEAHGAARSQDRWDEDAFQRSRMSEKISMLRGFLPEFLVEHPKLYSILSKGIHELLENECLKHFPVIKVGIELILDEKLEVLRKKEKLAAASKAIQEAGLELKDK